MWQRKYYYIYHTSNIHCVRIAVRVGLIIFKLHKAAAHREGHCGQNANTRCWRTAALRLYNCNTAQLLQSIGRARHVS